MCNCIDRNTSLYDSPSNSSLSNTYYIRSVGKNQFPLFSLFTLPRWTKKRTILQSSRFLRSTTLPFLRKFVKCVFHILNRAISLNRNLVEDDVVSFRQVRQPTNTVCLGFFSVVHSVQFGKLVEPCGADAAEELAMIEDDFLQNSEYAP